MCLNVVRSKNSQIFIGLKFIEDFIFSFDFLLNKYFNNHTGITVVFESHYQ